MTLSSIAPETAQLLQHLTDGQAQFSDVLAHIAAHYDYTPAGFRNGELHNSAEQNQGSARVLAFALLNGLDQQQTLQLFAEHYRAVLADSAGQDHQDIRQFMQHGWDQVEFEQPVLWARIAD